MAEALNTPIGLTPQSFQEMITGAGAGYTELELTEGMTAEAVSEELKTASETGACIGATRGGFGFDFAFDTREIEADGATFAFVGSTQLKVMNAQVKTTLLEATPGTFKRVFGNAELNAAKNHIKFRTQFTKDSYIPKIWFIMERVGGGYVGVLLKYALNTEGSSMQTTHEGEMELPVTLKGHQGDLADSQYGPAEIFWFYPEDEGAEPETRQAAPAKTTTAKDSTDKLGL